MQELSHTWVELLIPFFQVTVRAWMHTSEACVCLGPPLPLVTDLLHELSRRSCPHPFPLIRSLLRSLSRVFSAEARIRVCFSSVWVRTFFVNPAAVAETVSSIVVVVVA
jgi:hypothetical protein